MVQWFIQFFDKKFSGVAVIRARKSVIKSEILLNQQLAEEFTSHLLTNLKDETCTHLLKTFFGVLI